MSTAKERAGQILAGHFPPKWSNENLRDRVLEFGAAIYAQAIEDAAKAAESHMVEGFITYNNACRRAAKAIRALAGKAESSQK